MSIPHAKTWVDRLIEARHEGPDAIIALGIELDARQQEIALYEWRGYTLWRGQPGIEHEVMGVISPENAARRIYYPGTREMYCRPYFGCSSEFGPTISGYNHELHKLAQAGYAVTYVTPKHAYIARLLVDEEAKGPTGSNQ